MAVLRHASGDRQSDGVCALLRGSAVNQDGRSSSLTAPNGPSQSSLIAATLRAAGAAPHRQPQMFSSRCQSLSKVRGMMALPSNLLRDAGMEASEVGYMSVHGTGTPLGDPIELGALGQALSGTAGLQHERLVLGAVKSCYGHTEGAAGLTGALLAVNAISQQVGCLWHVAELSKPCPTFAWSRESGSDEPFSSRLWVIRVMRPLCDLCRAASPLHSDERRLRRPSCTAAT